MSTASLMVAAAPDMGLLSCIEHFLDRCVCDEGKIAARFAEMPVGRLLRGGCTQHKLTSKQHFTKLRSRTQKCLQVCGRLCLLGVTRDEECEMVVESED